MKLFEVNGQLNLNTTDVYINGQKSDLNICQISNAEYTKLVQTDSCLSNTLYLVDTEEIDAKGQRIINVSDPKDGNDAVTLDYFRACLSAMQSNLESKIPNFTKDDIAAIVKEVLKGILASI